jgi:hypothetical protein
MKAKPRACWWVLKVINPGRAGKAIKYLEAG